ncbi:hypothetical protein [Oricola indica]|uniref:hypothetical protein n=1 Tax=Oricola indica TaxID=2872591 RepID=UPI003CCB8790
MQIETVGKTTVCAAAALAAAAVPAGAADLYCRQSHTLIWSGSDPVLIEQDGQEFWLSTENGRWAERTIGSRAGIGDGGILDIRSDGSGYRANWVGVSGGPAETLTLDLESEPVAYLWSRRDETALIGTCVDTAGREFFDGVEIEREGE